MIGVWRENSGHESAIFAALSDRLNSFGGRTIELQPTPEYDTVVQSGSCMQCHDTYNEESDYVSTAVLRYIVLYQNNRKIKNRETHYSIKLYTYIL